MRRSLVWPSSIVLALVTGAALSQSLALVSTPPIAQVQPEITADIARTFYESVNAVLRTGDASALEETVALDFVDHTELPGVSSDRLGLGRYLIAVHALASETRILVDDIVIVGDQAMVQVRISGLEPSAFLGASLDRAPVVWGTTDVIRIAHRRVVERWSNADGLILAETLGATETGTRLPADPALALERVRFLPGEAAAGSTRESRLLWIEMGNLTIAIGAGSTAPALLADRTTGVAPGRPRLAAPGSDLVLSPGDLIALPASTDYTLRNDGSGTATALVTAIYRADDLTRSAPPSDPALPDPPSPWPPAISVQPLAGGTASGLLTGHAVARLGRLTLAPGTTLSALATPGSVLVVIESGATDVAVTGGEAWVRRDTTGAMQASTSGTLTAGDGALVNPGATVSFANTSDSSAVILLLTVTPVE